MPMTVEEPHSQRRQDHYHHYRSAARSDMNRLSAKMAEEVVCMKSRHLGSAASTVSGPTGSGGCAGELCRAVQNTFVASRIVLKGWGCWRNFPGTSITLDEAKSLVSMAKARLKQDDLSVFDWGLDRSCTREF